MDKWDCTWKLGLTILTRTMMDEKKVMSVVYSCSKWIDENKLWSIFGISLILIHSRQLYIQYLTGFFVSTWKIYSNRILSTNTDNFFMNAEQGLMTQWIFTDRQEILLHSNNIEFCLDEHKFIPFEYDWVC